ncbi:MAG: hypothetical protein ACRD0N_03905 [Acidimicrobiales bacterium]
MPTTLAQPERLARRTLAAATCCLVLGGGCVGWGGGGGAVALRDELEELAPTDAGTYELVGTERDSRTKEVRRVAETYEVQPWFERSGHKRQITEVRYQDGASRTWETVFEADGAYRLRETAGASSWEWDPPLLSVGAPLRRGRVWFAESRALLPDVSGMRRATHIFSRSEVVGTATVSVGDTRVFCFVIEGETTTTVTNTQRADQTRSSYVNRTEARTWFSPRHMQAVRAWSTTAVQSGTLEEPEEYELVRRVELERL